MPGRLKIVLTFDDGPSSGQQSSQNLTRNIMDTLDSRGIQGVFFIQSHALDNDTPFRGSSDVGRAIIRDMQADGHIIGVHTGAEENNAHSWANNHVNRLAAGELYGDITRAQNLIEDETDDHGGVEFIRPPFGEINSGVIDQYSDLALQYVGWNIDPENNSGGTAAGILANIESQMELYLADGDKTQIVVLLHDVQSVVAYNLVSFIDKIDEVARDMGYTPDFHPSDSETRMVLRSQSNEN